MSPRNMLSRAKAVMRRWASADRVALLGMALVVVPLTAALFPSAVGAVVPPTLLVAVGYWLVGKSLRNDAGLVVYAIFGGAVAGYVNTSASVHLHLWLSGSFEALPMSGLYSLLFGFFGCFHGVAYGLILLPPLWLARRARRFHSAEAVDRALSGMGLWGLMTVGITAPLSEHVAIERLPFDGTPAEPTLLPMLAWTVGAVCCLFMLVLGLERLRERRSWLARVRQGAVPGWLVIASEHVEAFDELPVFCPRLVGRERPLKLVLAEGTPSKGAYRSESVIPRFRVA